MSEYLDVEKLETEPVTGGEEPTNDVQNQVKLVTVVAAGEQGPSCQKFGEDASHSPNIDGLRQPRCQ